MEMRGKIQTLKVKVVGSIKGVWGIYMTMQDILSISFKN